MLETGEVLLGGKGESQALAEQAPVFAPLVDRFGPARVASGREVFPALVEAIANQQLSVQAGATVYGRIEDLCEGPPDARALLDADDEALRACGLSRPKVGYAKDLARAVTTGRVDPTALEEAPDAAIVETLTQVKGIGEWTAQMVLIFTLHRPDVLPTGDLGVRDGARRVLDLEQRPSEETLSEIGAAWAPYRSLASWYLWKERDRQLTDAGKR